MQNKIDQNAAIKQLEEILNKLSRRGLMDYMTHSCGMEFYPEWHDVDRQVLIDLALKADYGVIAFDAYREKFPVGG